MTRWQKLGKGIVTGCTASVVLFIMGMNLPINAARRETRGQKTESGIYLPSSRGFMDDLTLTTATHVQARWMLAALTDVASWVRMKFKAVKSRSLVIKTGQTTERFKLYVQNEEIPSSTVEALLERITSQHLRKWLGVPPSFTSIGLSGKTNKLQLPLSSLV